MKHLKALTACNAIYLANGVDTTLWSNTASCSGWDAIVALSGDTCNEWANIPSDGITSIAANSGYSISFTKYVSTLAYDTVRILYDVYPESLEVKEDDFCYVKYSNDAGSSWITAATYDDKDTDSTHSDIINCNNAADNNANFRVKFEAVNNNYATDRKNDWCSWRNMKILADFIPTSYPTSSPTGAISTTINPTVTILTTDIITPSPVTPWPTTTRKPSILLNTESDKGMGGYEDIDSTEPVTGTWVFVVLGVAGCCCILAGVIYINTQKHTHIITLISTKIKPKQCKVEKIENNIEMNETDYGNVITGAFYVTPEEPEGNVEWMFGTSQRTNMTQ